MHVDAAASFVAHRPHDYARMVFISLYESHGSVHMGSLPRRVVTEGFVAKSHTVALVVCLVHDVEAVFVTQFVEYREVGVVACAYHIDVGLLHHTQISVNGCFINCSAAAWVKFVAVDAF